MWKVSHNILDCVQIQAMSDLGAVAQAAAVRA